MTSDPLAFEPVFMERIWGGRGLERRFGKKLPAGKWIGESWEISDRPEAQSVVRSGPWAGKTLHDLWSNHRAEIFGSVPEAPRFPLLVKLLDAREKLSLQVHPPAAIAKQLGGEPKTEFWYVAHAEPDAELHVGLRAPTTRADFAKAVSNGTLEQHLHTIRVRPGDAMFLPSGRFHAIGAGNLLVEIQQNSDTTYRVFDWNRTDDQGKPRELHVEQALQSIDFTDAQPALCPKDNETLVRNELFQVEKWELKAPRELAPGGQFAIGFVLDGSVRCGSTSFDRGQFFILPANATTRAIAPGGTAATILRITIPRGD